MNISQSEKFSLSKIGLAIAAPLAAAVFSIVISSLAVIASNKSLILDDTTNQKNQLRFRELQNKAVQAESEFRSTIVAKQNEEVERNFAQIMDLVNEYATEKSLDLVVNKNQVVFVNPKFEITNEIIEIVKTKELYLEYVEGMYEAEVTA
jgi:hypothetical protein